MTSTVLSEASLGEPSSVEEEPLVEVVVQGATSPLDTSSLFGRGQGVLAGDRSVGVTFLLGHQEFVNVRDQLLDGAREVSLGVHARDITAIERRGTEPSPAIRSLA